MTTASTPHAALVRRIAADIVSAAPFDGYGDDVGSSFADGYAVQDALVAHLVAEGIRGRVAGYKVAANAPHLLEKLGLPEPLSARIFADQYLDSPADLSAKAFRQRAFEPEIAALIASDVPAGAHDRDSILPHVARLVPAFEVLDMREVQMSPAAMPWAVAQNISNEGVVIGGPGLPPGEVDPASLRACVTFAGSELADVTGKAPQHPLDVVAWIAGHLARRGLGLTAGMVVMCGTHTPILFPEGAGLLRLEMPGLGEAEVMLG